MAQVQFQENKSHFYLLQAQTDTSTLADAVDIWIRMIEDLPHSDRINPKILERGNMILTGVATAAHMLHPLYRGKFPLKININNCCV